MNPIFVVIRIVQNPHARESFINGLYAFPEEKGPTYGVYLYRDGDFILKHSGVSRERLVVAHRFDDDEDTLSGCEEE